MPTVETRLSILGAATSVFAENGFRAATMHEIAARAGVNEITLYRYFPQKRDLHHAVLDWKLSLLNLPELALRLRADDATGPRETLKCLTQFVLDGIDKNPQLPMLVLFAFVELPMERDAIIREHFQKLIDALRDRVRAWIASKQFRNVQPDIAVLAIASGIAVRLNAGWIGQELGLGAISNKEYAAHCVDVLMNGLVARPEPADVKNRERCRVVPI